MTREDYEATLAALGIANDAYAIVPHQVEIVAETAKAICVRVPNGMAGEKDLWFPKSQCASVPTQHAGRQFAVKKSWLSRQRLWGVTK